MFCPKCGIAIQERLPYCPNCGAKVAGHGAQQQERPQQIYGKPQDFYDQTENSPKKRQRRLLWLMVGSLLIIGILVAALLLLPRGGTEAEAPQPSAGAVDTQAPEDTEPDLAIYTEPRERTETAQTAAAPAAPVEIFGEESQLFSVAEAYAIARFNGDLRAMDEADIARVLEDFRDGLLGAYASEEEALANWPTLQGTPADSVEAAAQDWRDRRRLEQEAVYGPDYGVSAAADNAAYYSQADARILVDWLAQANAKWSGNRLSAYVDFEEIASAALVTVTVTVDGQAESREEQMDLLAVYAQDRWWIMDDMMEEN